jgi:hypothetical protein
MALHPGDIIWVPAGEHGHDHRLGEVLEVAGGAGHQRLLVRWEDDRESLSIPSQGVRVRHRRGPATDEEGSHAPQTWVPLHA